MINECENLEKCPFFLQFSGNSEVVKNGWVKLFCQDSLRSARCKRKQYKAQRGTMPPPSMTPTGIILGV